MNDQNNFPKEITKTSAVQLHDSGLRAGGLIDQSLSRLNQEQAQNLMLKAGEEALRLEVKSRTQNLDYVVGKKTIEDHIETFDMLDKRGRTTRQTVKSEIKTGAGNMKIESKSGATCFVASVAYRDPNHVDVMFLRKLRDEHLNQSAIGRSFIKWYWANGPKIANLVGKSEGLKNCSQFILAKFVSLLRIIVR